MIPTRIPSITISSACYAALLVAVCGAAHAAASASLAHFVTRNGSQLQVNGHPFHFAGALHIAAGPVAGTNHDACCLMAGGYACP